MLKVALFLPQKYAPRGKLKRFIRTNNNNNDNACIQKMRKTNFMALLTLLVNSGVEHIKDCCIFV